MVGAELAVLEDLPARTTGPGTAAFVGSGNVIYRPWKAVWVAPYVTAGGSAALGERLALRADVRFVHLDDAPNYWRTYAGLAVRLISR